jgi:hypothetical protein
VDIKSFSSFVHKKKLFFISSNFGFGSNKYPRHSFTLFFFVTDIEVLPCDSERGLKSHLKHASN